MTPQSLVVSFGSEEVGYPTALGTIVFRDDWLPDSKLTNRRNRGNAPWKNSHHIVLNDVEDGTFIADVWEYIVAHDWNQPSVQKLYKLNSDGSFSMYDSNRPSINGPVCNGPLSQVLLRGVVGRPISVGEFARCGFSIIDKKGSWSLDDIPFLTTSESGDATHLKTHSIAVLKEKQGVPDEIKIQGYVRYYKDEICHILGKEYYLTKEFFNESFDALTDFFASRNVSLFEIANKLKEEGGLMYTGDLGAIQKIVYGAPGTGKSFGTDDKLKDVQGNPKAECYRTTFHPDSDYSSFVGAYKPTMDAAKRIIYSFRPQAFMEAYVKAWRIAAGKEAGNHLPVALVIEEINRGNCAQIFGDLFQLLDRDDDTGYSTYPITTDVDLAKWLAEGEQFGAGLTGISKPVNIKQSDWDKILKGEMLALPPNLYIWATMNTSDQSLFPIDSAFKRRWDWQYVPISKPTEAGFVDRKIVVNGFKYDWWDFITIVNEHIADMTKSEDKKLGYFFVKAPKASGEITAERFANKVLFYLFNDVFKDWELPENIFGRAAGGGKKFAFKDFFYEEKMNVGAKTFYPGDVKEAEIAEFIEHQKLGTKIVGITPVNTGGGVATDDVEHMAAE